MTDKKKQPQYKPVQIQQYSPSILNDKSEVEIRREKKKKMMAFKTFLNPVEHSPMEGLVIKRKFSGDQMAQQQLSISPTCKICNNHLSEKSKICEFCKQMVCIQHIRKKRRNRQTNKFSRICDYCQDKYLHQKYLKNELKIEQSLMAQQLILESSTAQARQKFNRKKNQYDILQQKKKQLDDTFREQRTKLKQMQNQYDKAIRQLILNNQQNTNLQSKLQLLSRNLPPSLQIDYEFLLQENDRITEDLVKFQKLCRDAIQARSIREKQMYEEYYQWQNQQKQKLESQDQKKQQCQIY